jgi:hypothetical protein
MTAVDLEDIHEIDWSAVHHAYGPATDVPELLTSLARGENLKNVCWELWGNLFHQGTTYQASHVAVPFLWRILREGAPTSEVRLFLLTYLRGLARGYPAFPERPDPQLWSTWVDTFEAEDARGSSKKTRASSKPRAASIDEASYWTAKSYFAVEEGLEAAIPFAQSNDASIALQATALLSDFPRKRALVAPALTKIAHGLRSCSWPRSESSRRDRVRSGRRSGRWQARHRAGCRRSFTRTRSRHCLSSIKARAPSVV